MALESIIEQILAKAEKEKAGIIQKAEEEKSRILKEAREEAGMLYEAKIKEEKLALESQKQKVLVNMRLEAKKDLLNTKQEMIEKIFDIIKPHISEKILKKEMIKKDGVEETTEKSDFYMAKIRFDYETDVAKILFGNR